MSLECRPATAALNLQRRTIAGLVRGATECEGAALTHGESGAGLLKLRFRLERFADGEIGCQHRKLP